VYIVSWLCVPPVEAAILAMPPSHLLYAVVDKIDVKVYNIITYIYVVFVRKGRKKWRT
jgi:hypothetical protein